MKWIVQKSMTELYDWRTIGFIKTLENLKIDHKVLDFNMQNAHNFEWPIVEDDEGIILYGSHKFCISTPKAYYPGAYGLCQSLSSDHYYCNVPNEWLLNDDFHILPYKILLQRYPDHKLFVRPVVGTKTFAGQVCNRHEFEMLQHGTSVQNETLCMFASLKNIEEEYRFVICNGEVIDGSMYSAEERTNFRHDFTQEAYNLAQKMANLKWQPDLVYTCDVAKLRNGIYKIIELNSFSCAGLYAVDLEKVLKIITKTAIMEIDGKI